MQAEDPPLKQRFRSSASIVAVGCSVTFLFVRQLLALLSLGPMPDERDLETAVLRHHLVVLGRPPSLTFSRHDVLGGLSRTSAISSTRRLDNTRRHPLAHHSRRVLRYLSLVPSKDRLGARGKWDAPDTQEQRKQFVIADEYEDLLNPFYAESLVREGEALIGEVAARE